jgi:hypothetical protein
MVWGVKKSLTYLIGSVSIAAAAICNYCIAAGLEHVTIYFSPAFCSTTSTRNY